MHHDLTHEIQQTLLDKRYGFKHSGEFLRGGLCPKCEGKSLWTLFEKPYYIKCDHVNRCTKEWNIKEFLPEIFENLNQRYPATPENPNQTADVYLSWQRGLDVSQLHGCYVQDKYWKANANKGTATVRFYLRPDKSVYWERLIEEVIVTDNDGNTKTKKMDFGPFGCSYRGLWWQPPTLTIKENSEVIWTEGIIDALSLYQNGHPAVAIMSAGGFPTESITPYLGKGITWIIGLDNDKAGRKYLAQHAKKLRDMGENVSAILSSDDSLKRDWNDLHKTQQLTKKHLQTYRILGQIALAETKEEKAFYIFSQGDETKKHLVIDFKNSTYRVTVDRESYAEYSKTPETQFEKKNRIKLAAFKNAAKIERIAAFRIEYLYYQQSELNSGKYVLRIHYANKAPCTEIAIAHGSFISATKFTEALLAAHGAMFNGDTKDVKVLYEQWVKNWKKSVKLIDFIGYDNGNGSKDNQGTKAYIFHDIAVQNGTVIKLNSENYFSLSSGIGVKTGIKSHYQDISTNEPVNFMPDFELAFGVKGIVGLANLLGSLFAEQIRNYLGFYYFFELWDEKGGSGKSSLAIFLLKLIGRDLNEFNPNTGTEKGRQRRFADTANMPIVLNETDSEQLGDKRQHSKKFDWDTDSKSLYDGMVGNSRASFTNDNQSHTSRFRGALWVIQNVQVNATRSTLSRFVSLYFDTKHHSHDGYAASERLKAFKKQDVSGFLIKALKNENGFLKTFKSSYIDHNKRLQTIGIKEQRIIDNHAHLLALIDCLPMVVPLDDRYRNAAKSLVEKMAKERETLLQRDHPVVIEFWQTFNDLNHGLLRKKRIEDVYNTDIQLQEHVYVNEEDQLNHSRDDSKIAVSLIEYAKVCRDNGLFADVKELRQQLVHSKNPQYLESNVPINSKVTRKSIRCMVFKK